MSERRGSIQANQHQQVNFEGETQIKREFEMKNFQLESSTTGNERAPVVVEMGKVKSQLFVRKVTSLTHVAATIFLLLQRRISCFTSI